MTTPRGLLASTLVTSLLACTGCGFGSPAAFSLASASVDPAFSCPQGASNNGYQLHGTIDARNPTSAAVTIKTVAAVMTLASVQGSWLQHVGDRYSTRDVIFTPARVGPGSNMKINVTIRSACTNGNLPNQPASYGDYAVAFTVLTSAGSSSVSSSNKHRISTA